MNLPHGYSPHSSLRSSPHGSSPIGRPCPVDRPRFSTRVVVVIFTLGLTALSACNPYSRDDLLFALSLPPKEDVAIAPPGVVVDSSEEGVVNQSAAARALSPACNDRNLRCTAQTTASAFNRLTFSMLSIIDNIVSTPPSYRGTVDGNPRRIWGPVYVEDTQSTIRFEMVLDIERQEFEICLAAARGNLDDKPEPDEMNCDSDAGDFGMISFLTGRFQPGDIENGRARSGTGELVLDANAINELNPDDPFVGLYVLNYDNSADVQRVSVDVTEIPGNDLVAAAYAFSRTKSTGAGTFSFSVLEDFTPGVFGAGLDLERLDVTAQWNADLAGRGDAIVSGGDLNDLTYGVTHCWASDLATTFFEDPDDNHPTIGDASNCIFAEPFVAE